MALLQASWGATIGALFGILVAWKLYITFYRIFFHPLKEFPGPWLSRVSYFYEFYYDLWLPGQFSWKLKDLHKRYGPVVRINPDELHINDPDYYDELYNNKNAPVEKPLKEASVFGPYPAAMGTIDHVLHRTRRSALNLFFSRRSVQELMPNLRPVLMNFRKRLDDASETGETVNLKYAYNAMTMDNMTEYCFSRRSDKVLSPDFDKPTLDRVEDSHHSSQLNMHLPKTLGLQHKIPEWVNRIFNPTVADVHVLREMVSKQIEDIRAGRDTSHESSGHRTIFHHLLSDASNLPPAEKTRERLRDEAFSLVLAGAQTTAHVLYQTTYHIAANPKVRARLLEEIKPVLPGRDDVASNVVLEKIPYLQAVVNEGLRMAHASAHRLVRVFPKKSFVIADKTIPPNTHVGMTAMLVHENEDIFPEPKTFRPERWLTTDEHGNEVFNKNLQRYLVAFSKGSRGCLGLNLAWAELYIVLSTVVRRYEFDLSRVVRERDIDVCRDQFVGVSSAESRGLVVGVKVIE